MHIPTLEIPFLCGIVAYWYLCFSQGLALYHNNKLSDYCIITSTVKTFLYLSNPKKKKWRHADFRIGRQLGGRIRKRF